MNTQLMIETHGDPLGAIQGFIMNLWEEFSLDAMVVSQHQTIIPGEKESTPLIYQPGKMAEINPFKPLMTTNTAKMIPELMKVNPQSKLGLLLRPCESRALSEMITRGVIDQDRLIIISIDCLGTYPADEHHWRSQRKGSSEALTRESIQFARVGGIAAYRFRSACQRCISPKAYQGDINIGVLGLPVRQHILIEIFDERIPELSRLIPYTNGLANESQVFERERCIDRITGRNQNTHERIIQNLFDILPKHVTELIHQFKNCGSCQICLENCPICAVDYPRRRKDGRYVRADITRWILSCAGCGMCEQSCPNRLPLSVIFRHLKQQLDDSRQIILNEVPEEHLSPIQ